MSLYTENVCLEPIRLPSGKWAWQLTADLYWEVGYKGSDLWVRVPKGFITDLMSLPWIARRFLDRNDPCTAKAACVHDWMRPTPEDIVGQDRPKWDVQTAAGEFFHMMKADGVSRWRRVLCYLAVTLCGTRPNEW